MGPATDLCPEYIPQVPESIPDVVQIASMLNVNVNMLALKLIETKDEQLKARLPFIPNRKFMGTITDRADSIG